MNFYNFKFIYFFYFLFCKLLLFYQDNCNNIKIILYPNYISLLHFQFIKFMDFQYPYPKFI